MADDDATSALIAQMLAEDYATAARQMTFYEEDFDSSDEEFEKRRKKKASAKKPRGKVSEPRRHSEPAPTPRTPEPRPVDKAVQDSDSPDHVPGTSNASAEVSATGRKKRKDSGVNRAIPHKAWTEEEEKLFAEGLEQFGRDWVAVGHHIGTRDARSVSSHAQKYFIKLFVDGKPLPNKVVESGSGFTLSGKPLDLTSAAFAAYAGPKGRAIAAAATATSARPREQPAVVSPPASEAAPEVVETPARVEGVTHVVGQGNEPVASVCEPVAPKPAPKRRQPKVAGPPKKPKRVRDLDVDLAGRTEYSRQRSRRASTNPFVKSRDGALEMVTMKKYSGGVGTSKGQPFRVVVAADVLLLADLHAHLSSDEVIGFLGGKWDREASTLHITHVFPGKSVHVCGNQRCVVVASARQCGFCAAQGEDVSAHVQCEMDPVQEVKIRGCDIDNQCNYQAFFRDHGAAVDPFVGLIVSPFDLRLPSLQSAVAWYYVSSPQTQPCPMVVDVDVVFDLPSGPPPAVGTTEDGIVPSDAVSPDVVPSKRLDALLEIVGSCVQHVRGVDPNETWRELGTAVSNAQKLRGSLLSRVQSAEPSWTSDANALVDHAISMLLTEGRGGEEARLFVASDPRLSTVPEVEFPQGLASFGDDIVSDEDDGCSDGDY